MADIYSEIRVDSITGKFDLSNVCTIICGRQFDIQDKIQEVLEDPNYSLVDDKHRCLLEYKCIKKPVKCIFEITRDN